VTFWIHRIIRSKFVVINEEKLQVFSFRIFDFTSDIEHLIEVLNLHSFNKNMSWLFSQVDYLNNNNNNLRNQKKKKKIKKERKVLFFSQSNSKNEP